MLSELGVEGMSVAVTLPEKTLKLLREESDAICGQAVVAVPRLRTFTGRLCWVCGVLPRVRWVVRALYAVIASHEREVQRRALEERTDGTLGKRNTWSRRTPEHLVHTMRVRLALIWVTAFFKTCSAQAQGTYYVE